FWHGSTTPTEGQILLDGIDLRESDVEDLRREIGVIFQDYMRYDLLVRENIGFGKVDSLGDRSRVESAAVNSLARSVIDRLPNGYDQMVGRRFEGGVDLSGGEWQKFALARAYMRDAQLPILDEPTATLDARAEYEVFQRFSELTRARMAVLISHRFSTVRMADGSWCWRTDRYESKEPGETWKTGKERRHAPRNGGMAGADACATRERKKTND